MGSASVHLQGPSLGFPSLPALYNIVLLLSPFGVNIYLVFQSPGG